FQGVAADGGLDPADVAVVEVVQAGGEPLVLAVQQHELQGAGEAVQVLAGVEQVDDLGGAGELVAGDVPDPGGTVADDGHLPDVIGAAADALGPGQAREGAGGLEGGDVAGGGPVADGIALVVDLALGEEDGHLDLAGACPAVGVLAVPALGLLPGHGDAGAVDDGVELVRQR